MQFVIDGVPVGKGRPRVTKHGYAYTPPRTKSYEELVQWSFRSANKQRLPIGKGQPVEAYFRVLVRRHPVQRRGRSVCVCTGPSGGL